LLPEPPPPQKVYFQLEQSILQNKRPTDMIHQFLTSGSKDANLIGNYLIDYRESVKLLTSPQGRAWLHRWLDDTLNFLQKIANEAQH